MRKKSRVFKRQFSKNLTKDDPIFGEIDDVIDLKEIMNPVHRL